MTSPAPTQITYLFDTTVFIDFMRGPRYQFYSSAAPYINDVLNKKIVGAISVITDYELWCGINKNKEGKHIIALLNYFKRFQFNVVIARKAGSLYKNHLTSKKLKNDVSAPDIILAATAEHYSCSILTRNPNHFSPFSSQVNIIPY